MSGSLRLTTLASLLFVSLLAPGCYYAHLASGQLKLLSAREAIEDVQGDPDTSDRLREQLALVVRAREFASELGLEVAGRYTSYVEWPGDRIITTVVATNPGEVEAASFHFPIVGTVPYKGFFDREKAEAEAQSLREGGQDVCIVAVTAYSTLGWMDDPITSPMLLRSDERLVETVLHELVHSTVFVKSQPEFNEGAARFIGQEAAVRFFDTEAERTRVEDDRRVSAALLGFREQVAALYAQELEATVSTATRSQLEASFRESLRALSVTTRDPVALAQRVRLNDACLAIGGTYAADDERHDELLAKLDGDLVAFIDRLRSVADAEDPRAAFFGPGAATDLARP